MTFSVKHVKKVKNEFSDLGYLFPKQVINSDRSSRHFYFQLLNVSSLTYFPFVGGANIGFYNITGNKQDNYRMKIFIFQEKEWKRQGEMG